MRSSTGCGPGGLRTAWGVGALVLALALASTGVAQEPAAGAATDASADADQADRDREARFLFEAGRTAYDAGRYKEALGHFQRAYELSQRPQLLYNVGQAADRLRQDQLALDAFERYLSALPAAANRPAVEERIKVLREVLAARQSEADAAPAPTPAETAQASPTLAEQAASGRAGGEAPRDQDENLLSQWWLWAAAGGVAAGVVVVAILVASSGDDGGGGVKGELVEGSDGNVIVALELP
jgi:tetratricopeptide (TPR) repeat protein